MASKKVPSEIWLRIIRDASYVPLVDTSDHDPLGHPAGVSHKIQSGKALEFYKEALSIKYTISLVCRSWHIIVDEFLYECIVVQDATHIPFLVDQLSRIGTRISSKIQRLELLFETPGRKIQYKGVSYNSKRLALAAAKLICLCPRLRAFSSSATLWQGRGIREGEFHQFLMAALLVVQDTIESLDLRSYHSTKTMLDFYYLHLPKLRLLICSWDSGCCVSPFDNLRCHTEVSTEHTDESLWEVDQISAENKYDSDDEFERSLSSKPKTRDISLWAYPYLHTLDLHFYGDWLPLHDMIPGYLDSLRHIVIGPVANMHILDHNWCFLSQVNIVTFRRAGLLQFHNLEYRLPPTVDTIVFHIQELPITPMAFPFIKRIGLMGVESLTPDEFDYAFDQFVGGWRSTEDNFAILEMIRFMDASVSTIRRTKQSQLRLWARRSWSKGVQLQDETGRPIMENSL